MNDKMKDRIIFLDASIIVLVVMKPVHWIWRTTGLDSFRQARLLVALSPAMVLIWWLVCWGPLDGLGGLSVLIWSLCCWLKLKDFARDEPRLRRAWANGQWFLTVNSAYLRVISLSLFVWLDVCRLAFELKPSLGWARIAVLLSCGFYCTVFAVAQYVHIIPPGRPRKPREKKDWLGWARLKLVPA